MLPGPPSRVAVSRMDRRNDRQPPPCRPWREPVLIFAGQPLEIDVMKLWR